MHPYVTSFHRLTGTVTFSIKKDGVSSPDNVQDSLGEASKFFAVRVSVQVPVFWTIQDLPVLRDLSYLLVEDGIYHLHRATAPRHDCRGQVNSYIVIRSVTKTLEKNQSN